VYWVTGLAGAGKTTIASALRDRLISAGRAVALLDGDAIRLALGGVHGYEVQDRLYLAGCYGRMAQLLAGQGLDVICATVSMFESVREWNRANIPGYVEIYVDAPDEVLHRRRELYSRADPGQVVGQGASYELPTRPDMTVINDGRLSPDEIARTVMQQFSRPR
jgi:adenylylsulfate kinase